MNPCGFEKRTTLRYTRVWSSESTRRFLNHRQEIIEQNLFLEDAETAVSPTDLLQTSLYAVKRLRKEG